MRVTVKPIPGLLSEQVRLHTKPDGNGSYAVFDDDTGDFVGTVGRSAKHQQKRWFCQLDGQPRSLWTYKTMRNAVRSLVV